MNTQNENDSHFVKHLKKKYPDIDIDATLQLIDSEIDLIKVGTKEDPDNPIMKGIKCELNKNLIIGILNKQQSSTNQPSTIESDLDEEKLDKLAEMVLIEDIGEIKNSEDAKFVMERTFAKECWKKGFRAANKEQSFTLKDVEDAWDKCDTFKGWVSTRELEDIKQQYLDKLKEKK